MPAPLTGRRIVVTRVRSAEDALSRKLRELGAEVLEFPAIVVAPLSATEARPLDEALRQLDRFDWAVFASANALEQTLERMRACSVSISVLARRRLAAVGPATAEGLTRRVRAPDLVPGVARGVALAAALAPQVGGRRILVPRAQDGRPEIVDGLEAAGAEVVAPSAYRTVAAPPESLRGLGDLLERREVDAVIFASPSAVRSVVAALGPRAELLAATRVAVIGPTTAEAVRAAGLRVDVEPASSSAGALSRAVADRLGRP